VHSIKAITKQRILEQNITSWRYLDKLYDGVSLLNDAGLEEVIVAVQWETTAYKVKTSSTAYCINNSLTKKIKAFSISKGIPK